MDNKFKFSKKIILSFIEAIERKFVRIFSIVIYIADGAKTEANNKAIGFVYN